MSRDDSLHGRKPNTGPFELFGSMETPESTEQTFRMGHIESGAVVAYEKCRAACFLNGAKFNAGAPHPSGKLHRVSE
jgi:hypothetical protein